MSTIEELATEVAALRRRVAATEGILEIQSLKARYGELVDQRYSAGGVVDEAWMGRIADEVGDDDGSFLPIRNGKWFFPPKSER